MEYLLLVPNNIKKEVIKKVREKYYNFNIKFMSLEEFSKKITFDYDEKTIYSVMKQFNINYKVALLYIKNLYYISDKLDNDKMKMLFDIKEYLDNNNLLKYNNQFKDYVKDKEIYLYGYDYINKYYRGILKNYNYKVIERNNNKYIIDKIYYADYIEDEVIFVANKIAKLIKNSIDIKKIKIIYSKEYEKIIERIFGYFKIPFKGIKKSLYSISSVKRVIRALDNIEEEIAKIKSADVVEKIINILNKYYFVDDKKEVIDLIINDLKNTYVDNGLFGIKSSNIDDYFSDEDYVFLMGFNKENIPVLYQDNDYFSDKEKLLLGLDDSNYLNMMIKESIRNRILSIKNLTITYKLYDDNSTYTKSNLIDAPLEKIVNNNYENSDMMNKVFLCKKIDKLVKYNIKDNDLSLLYNNYDIKYGTYDNKYKKIDKQKLYKYLDNKLTLSYTHLDNYNKCSFRYYLNNILKINIIKNDFAIIIGNICHYLLSIMNNDNFDLDKSFDEYLTNTRNLSKKEMFFLSNIKEEIRFIIDTLKKQLEFSSFDKELTEKKVFVNKDQNIKVTFMGVIDKIKYKEVDGITYLAIIDYKTGNTSIKINNIKYGLDMQLPIYLYLSSKMDFNNPKVVGFYLQKLLVTTLDNKKDYIEAKEDTLKLEGYSISEENILSLFDNTYNDSKLIKSMKTSSKGFYSYSKVLSSEEMDGIIKRTDNVIDETISNILEANFNINPKVIDGENASCAFCPYTDICFKKEEDIIYINREDDNSGI